MLGYNALNGEIAAEKWRASGGKTDNAVSFTAQGENIVEINRLAALVVIAGLCCKCKKAVSLYNVYCLGLAPMGVGESAAQHAVIFEKADEHVDLDELSRALQRIKSASRKAGDIGSKDKIKVNSHLLISFTAPG